MQSLSNITPEIIHARMQHRRTAVSIRRATLTDAKTIADMGNRLLPAAHMGALPMADMNLYLFESFNKGAVMTQLSTPGVCFWLAESNNEVVGMIKTDPTPPQMSDLGNRPVEFSRLYLESDWIGKGVGTALMQHARACTAYAGHDVCWLMVWTGNHRAVGFYRRWGFYIVGIINYPVGHSHLPAYVMASKTTNFNSNGY